MECLVMKFGGTSLGNEEKIKLVSEKIIKEISAKRRIIVVVSAMAGTTNSLVNKTEYFSNCKFNPEYDLVVSAGEQISAGLLSMYLNKKKINSRSILGWEIPIITDDSFGKAKILEIKKKKILKYLEEYQVLVVAGFQGISEKEKRITTLGRGGSDTSAVALASAIGSKLCEIYTDVDGIFTADPRFVPRAQRIRKISYEEILEMSSLGSKVLHPRSVELAMKYGIKVNVKNTFSKSSGTFLTDEDKTMERAIVSGISSSEDDSKITLIGIPDTPGIASKIFAPLTAENINVDMIVQNITEDGRFTNLTFTVKKNEMQKSVNALKNSNLKFRDIHVEPNICKLSIVGVGMKNNVGVAQKMFETLAKKKINIMVISTSEIKISVLIALNKKKTALIALHNVYGLDKKEN